MWKCELPRVWPLFHPTRRSCGAHYSGCSKSNCVDQETAELSFVFDTETSRQTARVWTGVDNETRQYFPPLTALAAEDYPTEDKCSLAIRLNYGKFDYFSVGDMDHEVDMAVSHGETLNQLSQGHPVPSKLRWQTITVGLMSAGPTGSTLFGPRSMSSTAGIPHTPP